jgi:hypothetical protein
MTLTPAATSFRERAELLEALDYDDLDDTDVASLTPEQADELAKRAASRSGQHRLDLTAASLPQKERP